MILPGGRFQVFVATRPVEFRKGMDSLAAVVQERLRLDPFSGAVFVFRAKRADRVKLLVWDGSGLTLIYKRLDEAKFVWPRIEDGVMRLSPGQLGAPSGAPTAARAMTLLPKHLPRHELVIEPNNQICPGCGGELHRIGEDLAERLDVIPAQFRVIVTRRSRYGCRACESAVIQAPAPAG